MLTKTTRLALKAVREFQERNGVRKEIFRNTPLHYHMVDLVSGLKDLAQARGLNFAEVVKEAKKAKVCKQTDVDEGMLHDDLEKRWPK